MDAAQDLARQIAELSRRVSAMERGSRLTRSSVEVDGRSVTIPQTVRDAQSAREDATVAIEAANGKNTVTYSPDEPTGDGGTEGDTWFQLEAGVVVGSWEWTGEAWEARSFGDAVLDSLTVGKLVSGEIAAGQRIIAGPAAGTHAEMSDTGFRVYADDPVDGIPNEVIRLGTGTDDYFAIVNADGTLAASVDQLGRGNFPSLNTREWPTIGAPDHTGQGGALLEILDRRGRGTLAYGASGSSVATNTTAGSGHFEIAARLYFGRLYRIHARGRLNATTADCLAEVQVRWTVADDVAGAAGTPSVASSIAARTQVGIPRPDGEGFTINKLFSLGPGTEGRNVRFLLSFGRPVGTGSVTMYGPAPDGPELWIEDIGPYTPNAQVANDGGGTPAPPAPQRLNKSWGASWARSYRSGGTISFDGAIYQGYGDATNGAQRSLIGFPNEIATELAGSTVEAVGLYLYAEHWWNNSGGIAVLGRHSHTAPPASWPGSGVIVDMGQSPPEGGAGLWPKPGGRWIDLMPHGGQGWANGTVRGVALGAGGMSTATTYYGRFAPPGSGQQPLINITYRK